MISKALDYDFQQEEKADFRGLSPLQIVHHISEFIS
jgi:hypothetical protein